MRFTPYVAASALAALASAQTWTECNPMEKECPNDPSMPATFDTDFKAGKDSVKGWKQTAGSLNYAAGGAEFTINKQGESPTIQSEGFLHFGYIEVKAKAAAGQGIISSIVLQSQDLDEVDWEFIGGVSDKVQMNYFGKGNVSAYDRMVEAPVGNVQEVHSYALNWTAESLTWIIDGTPVRTLMAGDANGGKNYPQTPVNVRIGIWAGGDPTNAPGVVEWAGGLTDFSKAPFTMTVESVKVINNHPATEYKWTDKSGSWESIEYIGEGNKDGAPQNSASIEPSATATGGGIASDINVPSGSATAAPSDAPPAEGSATPAPSDAPPAEGTPAPSDAPPADGISAPPAEGTPAPSDAPAATSTPCTTEGIALTSAAPQNPESPSCNCGVETVYVTGTPPPASEAPPASTPVVEVPIVSEAPPTNSEVPVVSEAPPAETPAPEVPIVSEAPPASSEVPVEVPASSEVPVEVPATSVPAGEVSATSLPVEVPASSILPEEPQKPSAPPATTPAQQPPYPTNPGIATDTAPAPVIPYPTAPTGAIPGNSTATSPPEFTGAASRHNLGALVAAVAGAMLLAF